MGAVSFSNLNVTVAQLLGMDGATPTAANNPLPIEFGASTTGVLTSGVISISAPGTSTLVAPTGTTTAIRAYNLMLSVSTATALTFLNGTTALTGAMTVAAGSPLVLPFSGEPWLSTSAAATLSVVSSVTSQISGAIGYTKA